VLLLMHLCLFLSGVLLHLPCCVCSLCLCAACAAAASLKAQLAEAMHNLSCTQQELTKALSDYVSNASSYALATSHFML
jgi:hypothetical protein